MFTLFAAAGVAPMAAPAPARADTVRGLQWHLDALKIPEAHRLTKGRGVVVAVVDTGVHGAHPDLKGQVLPGRGFGAGVAADGRTDPDTKEGHGTGMAGIIAGRGGGDMHALGIAPEAKILPVGLGAEDARSWDSGAAIRWAVDHGADVINMSFGKHVADPATTDAVRYALSKNVVVVASSGNSDSGYPKIPEPAAIPGVIAVGGATRSGGLWSETVTGPEMVLSAPGERIIAPAPPGASPNGYLVSDGTSSASAIVAGVAALVRSRYPDLDAANVVNRLISTAKDRGPKGRDADFGFGSIDVLAALTRSVPAVDANPLLASAAGSPAPGASAGGEKDGDDGPAVSVGLAEGAGLQIVFCLLAVLVAVAVIVILVVVNRRARRRAGAGPAGTRPGGYPPPGVYPPPGGYPPAGGPAPGAYPPPGGHPSPAPHHQAYPPATHPPYPPAPPAGFGPPQSYPPAGPPVTAPPYGPPPQSGPPSGAPGASPPGPQPGQ
ncbi:S8 family serine peptidase [Micromonospora krabiensis]|uniref:S8 family serine peptidase n=1 Tax=Micromonospora krabiensis TaxID=307121 RepID=UPI0015618335|nr:S8 family serine peptidase [Micromonospora krabiensis]